MPVWCQDEAGPYQAIPQPGAHWRPATSPARYPHEHIRHGTAKLLTLFHPASGQVRVKGVASAANAVLHPWLGAELTAILATLPEPPAQPEAERRAAWERWQAGLTVRFTLPDRLPPLRMLLVLDNLSGHKIPALVPTPRRSFGPASACSAASAPASGTTIPSAGPAPALVDRSIDDLPPPINGGIHAK